MEKAFDNFSFSEVVAQVQSAAISIICHIIFDLAVHGLAVALVLLIAGLVMGSMRHRLSKPFLVVARKLGTVCGIASLPGLITLCVSHTLPPVGVYNINSLGFLSLWSLISAHMIGEETNYQFTVKVKNESNLEESPE